MNPENLPPDIDPNLWIPCIHGSADRDYLFDAEWHTFPGRMAAYCPAHDQGYRISLSELPDDLPTPTRYWIKGYLAGNLPRQPDVDAVDEMNDPVMKHWLVKAHHFHLTGHWTPEPGGNG